MLDINLFREGKPILPVPKMGKIRSSASILLRFLT